MSEDGVLTFRSAAEAQRAAARMLEMEALETAHRLRTILAMMQAPRPFRGWFPPPPANDNRPDSPLLERHQEMRVDLRAAAEAAKDHAAMLRAACAAQTAAASEPNS
jgi:hypothetical protein